MACQSDRKFTLIATLAWIGLSAATDVTTEAQDRVTVLQAPDGGIQPQATIDSSGVIHLIYFKGTASSGDLFYTRRSPEASRFGEAVRVNSQPGSAIATGTIRGGQIALGLGGRVHVAWNGSGAARPENPSGGVPMLYARSSVPGAGFEPQRNLMTRTSGLDGGGTVAADEVGNVLVFWHGRAPDAKPGEAGRRMFVARSEDDGATFAPEVPALDRETGACACCGTRAMADHRGRVLALYRAAGSAGTERDMTLLISSDRGGHFREIPIHPWKINACPMSSASLAEGAGVILAAWETRGQVYFSRIGPDAETLSPPITPGLVGGQKHPAVAINSTGEALLAWTEGTAWQKGGTLAWQVFDRTGHPVGPQGRVEKGIPPWGLPTVVARPDGGFTIIR